MVLNGTPPENPNGNLLLDRIFGAKIHFCLRKDRDKTLYRVTEELSQKGQRPCVIPVGGSNSTGAVGYVNALLELKTQIDQMKITSDAIVFATSSGGIQAGLALWAKLIRFKLFALAILIRL